MTQKKPAIILLSGGLDSTTVLAIAGNRGYSCNCLSFDYGQKQTVELEKAAKIAEKFQAERHLVLRLDLDRIGGSALTGDMEVPKDRSPEQQQAIPVTYVPARNIIFVSFAASFAEAIGAGAIFIGANAVDYSGYPDCRPEFIEAFANMARLATKVGVEGQALKFETPLLHLSKANIIRLGLDHGVDYSQTVSCYQADDQGRACGTCDSCRLRKQGFADAGVEDPTRYIP